MILLKGIFKDKSPIVQLGILILSVLLCSVLASTIAYGIFFIIYGTTDLMKYPAALRIIQFISATGTFLLPAFIMAQTCSTNVQAYLSMKGMPSFKVLTAATIALLLLSPTITLTGMLNMQMKLPEFLAPLEEWMMTQEETMKTFTELLIGDGSLPVLFANLIVIALTAGLTEEFIFRGALQRVFERIIHNHHAVIWVTAILFSAFHLQFYGFIPRMLLGAFFGYVLYWGKNIWVPVFIHFMNNAIAVIGMSDANLKDNEFITGEISDENLLPYTLAAIAALCLFYFCCKYLKKYLKEDKSEILLP